MVLNLWLVLRLFRFENNEVKELKKFSVSPLIVKLRYPTIEFLTSDDKEPIISVQGTHTDGVYEMPNNIGPFDYLSYCCRIGEAEFRLWNIKPKLMVELWKKLVKTNQIRSFLCDMYTDDVRVKNIVLKVKDLLK